MKSEKITYWLPRIISIIFIIFLLLFSFDVFGMSGSGVDKARGFLISNIPVIALAAILLVAWIKEYIGGILFLLAAVFFTFFFRTYENIGNFILISLPLFLVALLFISNGYGKTKRS